MILIFPVLCPSPCLHNAAGLRCETHCPELQRRSRAREEEAPREGPKPTQPAMIILNMAMIIGYNLTYVLQYKIGVIGWNGIKWDYRWGYSGIS